MAGSRGCTLLGSTVDVESVSAAGTRSSVISNDALALISISDRCDRLETSDEYWGKIQSESECHK